MSLRGFNALLALLLALSLGLKTAAASGEPQPDVAAALAGLANMLAENGYSARVRSLPRSPGMFVEADAGNCRLLAGEYPVHDTFANVYRDMRKGDDRLLFVHRGQVHASAPKARSMTDFFLWRELRRVGIAHRRTPVFALIASPGCNVRALPWQRVAFAEA